MMTDVDASPALSRILALSLSRIFVCFYPMESIPFSQWQGLKMWTHARKRAGADAVDGGCCVLPL